MDESDAHPRASLTSSTRSMHAQPMATSTGVHPVTVDYNDLAIIIVYSNMDEGIDDAWCNEIGTLGLQEGQVTRSGTLEHWATRSFRLYANNPQLQLLFRCNSADHANHNNPRHSNVNAVHVGDYAHQNLFLLDGLICELKKQSFRASAKVLFLPSSAVQCAMLGLPHLPHTANTSPTSSDRFIPKSKNDKTPFSLVAVDNSVSGVTVQYCATWKEVKTSLQASQGLTCLYLQTTMAFRRIMTETQRQTALNRLMGELPRASSTSSSSSSSAITRPPPFIYPPYELNDMADNKRRTHELFGEHMLPQLWVAVTNGVDDESSFPAALQTEVSRICALMMRWAESTNCIGKQVVVKGGDSTCATSFHDFKLIAPSSASSSAASHCAKLVQAVHTLIVDQHQHCIGIQPFNPHLRKLEYRVFCFAVEVEASESPNGFYQGAIVETSTKSNVKMGRLMDARSGHQTTKLPNRACEVLARKLIKSSEANHVQYWSHLRTKLRLPVIRLDLFFDADEQKAYLKMAPAPDCVTFTSAHDVNLIEIIGNTMAKNILLEYKEKVQAST